MVIVITAMLAIALAFVAVSRDFGRTTHEAMMTTLRAIDASHALLQRDVLRARAGLLSSYDPLVASIVALRQATTGLETLIGEAGLESEGDLEKPLRSLKAGIDADEKLIEQFKTTNALFQNSIGVFGQTLTALHASPDDGVRSAISRVGDLGNLMMRFATATDRALEVAIRRDIAQLAVADAASSAPGLRTLLVHAELVLEFLPAVDAKILAIHASDTLTHAKRLQERYLEMFGDAASRAVWSRLVLGATAIALWLCILLVIFRLRNQTHYLKRRLRLDNAIAAVKNSINGAPLPEFPERMEEALAALARQFEVESSQLAIILAEQAEIMEAYRSHGGSEDDDALILEFASSLHRSGVARMGGRPRFDEGRLAERIRGRRTACAIAGVRLSGGRVGVLLVKFDASRPRPCAFATALMQTAVPTLVDLVESNHARREKKVLEQRLEQAQRLEAVGTLAGGIAHEFNNVLGSILGYSEMALQVLRRPSPSRRYVEKILASGERAKRIVDQILTLSRKRERTSKPFDMVEAITDIQPILQVTLADKVSLQTTLPNQAATIEGSPIELQQILLNLCKNAVEASARGQVVEIGVRRVRFNGRTILSHGEISWGAFICLSVRDHGIGMQEATLPHIFEPFFTTKSQSGGTGLGLAAVHGLVSGLGGRTNVRSSPGAGTTFEVFLPASDKVPLPIRNFYNERSTPTGQGQRVAILEGDTFLLRMYEDKVAALGYEPIGCSSLDEILLTAISSEGKPDVAILDVASLADRHSVAEVGAALRDVPQIFVADRERCRDLNGRPHAEASVLGKPINSRALAQALFDCLHPM
ncbi:two-component system VirA-like sensor kinase [Bosea caraganae]|nr:two-component system VirA-like sensor kinase [Bosea caraganae]